MASVQFEAVGVAVACLALVCVNAAEAAFINSDKLPFPAYTDPDPRGYYHDWGIGRDESDGFPDSSSSSDALSLLFGNGSVPIDFTASAPSVEFSMSAVPSGATAEYYVLLKVRNLMSVPWHGLEVHLDTDLPGLDFDHPFAAVPGWQELPEWNRQRATFQSARTIGWTSQMLDPGETAELFFYLDIPDHPDHPDVGYDFTFTITPLIPEPSTLLLALCGTGVIVTRRRR